MKARIYSHTDLIGTTDLVVGDESMGCVYGVFEPNESYYSKVQKSIREFWDKSNYELLAHLRLSVQLVNGYFLYPIGGITIDDIGELPDEPLRIDVAGLYRHVIEEYFHDQNESEFVQLPWRHLSIQEKIALENELEKEITDRSKEPIFKLFKKDRKRHVLDGYKFSALARDQRNDNVLFVTHKAGEQNGFAVVHLTWSGKLDENSNYPRTTFFSDLIAFTSTKMKNDMKEWGA